MSSFGFGGQGLERLGVRGLGFRGVGSFFGWFGGLGLQGRTLCLF